MAEQLLAKHPQASSDTTTGLQSNGDMEGPQRHGGQSLVWMDLSPHLNLIDHLELVAPSSICAAVQHFHLDLPRSAYRERLLPGLVPSYNLWVVVIFSQNGKLCDCFCYFDQVSQNRINLPPEKSIMNKCSSKEILMEQKICFFSHHYPTHPSILCNIHGE